VIKSGRVRWGGHVESIRESRNSNKVLRDTPEKRPLGRPRSTFGDIIKMYFKYDRGGSCT